MVPGFTAAAVAAALGACERSIDAPQADESLVSIAADAVLFDMMDHLTTNGVRSGAIRADTAYVYNDSSQIRMWGVDMTLYHDDGRERAHVTSERGVLHRDTEQMEARGNVVLVMNQGVQRVESPELYYDPRRNRIWSDSNSVFIREDGQVTRGTCFRSDLDFENFTVCSIRGAAGGGQGTPGGGRGPGGGETPGGVRDPGGGEPDGPGGTGLPEGGGRDEPDGTAGGGGGGAAHLVGGDVPGGGDDDDESGPRAAPARERVEP